MKELSTEQKAKEYDGNFEVYAELVNRLEEVKDAVLKHNYGIAIDVLYKPYPVFKVITHSEFKESDEEEIRKEMLEYCYKRMNNEFPSITIHQVKRWLAWLKKKGEQADNDIKESLRTEYEKGRADAIAEVQKSAWSEEDNINCKRLLYFLDGGHLMQGHKTELFIWVESIKERVQPQPHQEWSEEDKGNLLDVKCVIDKVWHNQYIREEISYSYEELESLWNWLDNIWRRVEYPQNTWKPSDEQIEILDMVLSNESMDDNVARILRDIREQLKKLKE